GPRGRAAHRAGQGPDERGARALGPPRSQRPTRSAGGAASGVSVSREGGPRRPTPTSAARGRASRVFQTRNRRPRARARDMVSGPPGERGAGLALLPYHLCSHLPGPKSAQTGGERRKGGRLRAGTEGKADYNHRVLKALFVQGLDIGSLDVLTHMAREVG